jgi:hypothetical protein
VRWYGCPINVSVMFHLFEALHSLGLTDTHFVTAFGCMSASGKAMVFTMKDLSGAIIFQQTQAVVSDIPGPVGILLRECHFVLCTGFLLTIKPLEGAGWPKACCSIGHGLCRRGGSFLSTRRQGQICNFLPLLEQYSACSSQLGSLERCWDCGDLQPGWRLHTKLRVIFKVSSPFPTL